MPECLRDTPAGPGPKQFYCPWIKMQCSWYYHQILLFSHSTATAHGVVPVVLSMIRCAGVAPPVPFAARINCPWARANPGHTAVHKTHHWPPRPPYAATAWRLRGAGRMSGAPTVSLTITLQLRRQSAQRHHRRQSALASPCRHRHRHRLFRRPLPAPGSCSDVPAARLHAARLDRRVPFHEQVHVRHARVVCGPFHKTNRKDLA